MSTVSRDIRLSVTAEMQKFAASMATMPGTTQKQAAAAARNLAREMAKAEVEVQKGAQATAREVAKANQQAAAAAAKAHKEAAEQTAEAHTAMMRNIKAGALAAAAAFVAFSKQAIQDTVALRTELSEFSTTSGLAAETLAGIGFAAERNGKSLGDFRSLLSDLPKRMMETAQGTGRAQKGFDALGVSVTEADGSLRSSDAVLSEVVSKIQSMEDPTQRAALAVQALGSDGSRLMQVLGQTELETFIGYTRAYGVDVGPDAIRTAEDWAAAQAELGSEIRAMTADLADLLIDTEKLRGFTTGLVAVYEMATRTVGGFVREMWSLESALKTIATGGIFSLVTLGQSASQAADDTADLLYERQKLLDQIVASQAETDDAVSSVVELASSQRDAAAAARAWAQEQARLAQELDRMLQGQAQMTAVMDRAREDQLSQVARINIAYQEQIVQVHQLAAATAALARTEMDRQIIREEEIATVDALIARRDRELAQIKEANAIDKQAIVDAQAMTAAKQQQAKAETNYGAILSTTGQVLGAVAQMAKNGSKGAAIAAKAGGIAQASINTGVAVTAALTIPPPVGQVLAGINAGIGAAQIAAIAATPIPAFASGGIVPRDAPRAMSSGLDERLITARPGEVVFTPDQLDAMKGGASTTTVNLRLDNRTMSRVIVQNGGAVSSAIGRDPIPRYGVSR